MMRKAQQGFKNIELFGSLLHHMDMGRPKNFRREEVLEKAIPVLTARKGSDGDSGLNSAHELSPGLVRIARHSLTRISGATWVSGAGTAQFIFGESTVFNFWIQVSPNGQVIDMVEADISSGNYEEGLAIRQATPITLSQLAGNWQATLVIDGGCGLGTKLVAFNLNSSGEGNAAAVYHTPGCGNNAPAGKIVIASLNIAGTGTAELILGATVFSFNIQVSPNGQVIQHGGYHRLRELR
jgi:hypothetical protein